MQFGISGAYTFIPIPSTLPIVPGAFGFGMGTRGPYAGSATPTILTVDNLNDSGNGSLRAGLEAAFPRFILPQISGNVNLASDITIVNPYFTLAGQTAPSPGLTVKNFGIQILAHDGLIQHVRIRAGDGPPLIPQTQDHDASTIYGGPTGGEAAYNIVFDHCSLSWAQDKLSIFYSVPLDSVATYWRNIFSESLYRAINIIPQGGSWASGAPSSLALSLGRGDSITASYVSVLQNLFAHNSDRNPEIQGPIRVHFINNVVYDWGKDANNYPWGTFLFNSGPDEPCLVDVIGNVYIAGPVTGSFLPLIAIGTWNQHPSALLYRTDNIIDQTKQAITLFDAHGPDPTTGSPPVSLTGITVLAGSATKASVLANCGARPLDRDAVDQRIISEVTNYTGNVISSQNSVGGWPTLAVNTAAFTIPANPHQVQPGGYTNLEIALHNRATVVGG